MTPIYIYRATDVTRRMKKKSDSMSRYTFAAIRTWAVAKWWPLFSPKNEGKRGRGAVKNPGAYISSALVGGLSIDHLVYRSLDSRDRARYVI